MSAKTIITYQLMNEGNADVVLRDLPSDTPISDAVERQKAALDLFEGRVAVAVFEAGQPRDLTPDEAEELQAALDQVCRSKITVHPHRP